MWCPPNSDHSDPSLQLLSDGHLVSLQPLALLTIRHAVHGTFRFLHLSLCLVLVRASIFLLPRFPVDVWSHLRFRSRLSWFSIYRHWSRYGHGKHWIHHALPLVS